MRNLRAPNSPPPFIYVYAPEHLYRVSLWIYIPDIVHPGIVGLTELWPAGRRTESNIFILFIFRIRVFDRILIWMFSLDPDTGGLAWSGPGCSGRIRTRVFWSDPDMGVFLFILIHVIFVLSWFWCSDRIRLFWSDLGIYPNPWVLFY